MPEPHEDLETTVSAQHSRITGLMRAVSHRDGEARSRAFADLARYLAIHEAAEQLFLHGSMIRDPDGNDGVAEQRVTEEQQATQVIQRLEQYDPDSFEFLTQFDLFQNAVSSHAEAEESEELPAFIDRTRPEDLERVVRALDMVDLWYEDSGPGSPVPRSGSFVDQHRRAEAAFRDLASGR